MRTMFLCITLAAALIATGCSDDAAPPIDGGIDSAPPSDATVADSEPLSDATVADSEPLSDATVADSAPLSDATVADSEPLSDATVADSEPLSDATVADSEPLTDTTVADSTPAPDMLPMDVGPLPDGVSQLCGNGSREGTEQCDDGNTINLDGCDAACMFEQDHRINYLQMQWGTDAFCTDNALGAAIADQLVRDQFQQMFTAGIADGSITILLKMIDLDDLTGANDPALSVGVMAGTPVPGAAYDGANDLDWWYDVSPASIDGQRNPLDQLSGGITGNLLTAGPGKVAMTVDIGGSLGTLSMSDTRITITTGASSAPLTSSGSPPGHLPAEHLEPTLVSYATAGTKDSTGAGKLCGGTTAESLQKIPLSATLAGFCQEGYTTQSSLLDLFVGGCTIFLLGTAIVPAQPDTADSTAAPLGAGPPYTLTADSTTLEVDGCLDKDDGPVDLNDCLAAAAYSTFIKFASGRVIIR